MLGCSLSANVTGQLIIPRVESNLSVIQIHLSAYQSSLHLSRTYDLRSCLTASLTSEASSDFQQSRGCKTTSITTLDSFRGKVDSLRGLGGSEETNQWPWSRGIISKFNNSAHEGNSHTKLKETSEVMIHASVLYMNLRKRKKLRLLLRFFSAGFGTRFRTGWKEQLWHSPEKWHLCSLHYLKGLVWILYSCCYKALNKGLRIN